MDDKVNYRIREQTRHLPGIGSYISYDILAYNSVQTIAIVPDVSTDKSFMLKMVQCFNDYELSLIHLYDVILDMLE